VDKIEFALGMSAVELPISPVRSGTIGRNLDYIETIDDAPMFLRMGLHGFDDEPRLRVLQASVTPPHGPRLADVFTRNNFSPDHLSGAYRQLQIA
jgi:hypothetical protein